LIGSSGTRNIEIFFVPFVVSPNFSGSESSVAIFIGGFLSSGLPVGLNRVSFKTRVCEDGAGVEDDVLGIECVDIKPGMFAVADGSEMELRLRTS
jgi:hypothetical protein